VSRLSQNLVLALLGGVLLQISAFSTEYVNYVKPGFRPFLIAAGAVIVLVGLVGLIQEIPRFRPGHGHHHGGPRVAWLLCLPAAAVVMIAPPALGSFAASRTETEAEAAAPLPPPAKVTSVKPKGKPVDLLLGEYMSRSWEGDKTLAGKTLRMTGFVTPSKKKDRWYVTRMHINCCAADAYALKVAVLGAPQPAADSWVEVSGTWVKIKPDQTPVLDATGVRSIPKPEQPYQ
jgi:uncharacterized repeat protein (TIGR03943 family)